MSISALPVSQYLKELAPESGRGKGIKAAAAVEEEKGVETAVLVAEAYAQGLAEGRAAVEAEFDRRAAQQLAASAEKLASERSRWTLEEGERLSGQIVSVMGEIEARVGDRVAQILRPVFSEEVRRRAVSDLIGALESLLSAGDFAKITVSGPEDLLESVRARLDGKMSNVTYHGAQGCDLRISLDETVLETRIGAWAQAIGGDKE